MSKYKAVVFDLFGTVALWHPDRLPVFEWQGKSMPSTMGELQAAIEAGATACIQPGGSKNDQEVIAAANEGGMSMVFTEHRHFRH